MASQKTINTKKKVVKKKVSSTKPVKETQKDKYFEAVGRRKSSSARVRIFANSGEKGGVTINEKELKDYFALKELQQIVISPFKKTSQVTKFFTSVKVYGGGIKSQSEAIRLGISRALIKYDIGLRPVLKAEKFLMRDARVKERRKFGLKKARKAPQWSKR